MGRKCSNVVFGGSEHCKVVLHDVAFQRLPRHFSLLAMMAPDSYVWQSQQRAFMNQIDTAIFPFENGLCHSGQYLPSLAKLNRGKVSSFPPLQN